jgi:NADH dehydrogenase
MANQTICLLGGTGFVGYHLANHLSRAGYKLRIPSRRRERHRDVLVIPTVDVVEANIHDDAQLGEVVRNCDIVINLVAILNERRRGDFQKTHVELAQRLIKACQNNGVSRLVHMSALNADAQRGPSAYLRTKGEGERLVLAAESEKLAVTVFRPSVIFGPGDHFFNRFAQLLRGLPILPLACPQAAFAPVYVEDVAGAIVASLRDMRTRGKRCDLCGPKSYSLLQLVEYTNRTLGTGRGVVPLGATTSSLMATVLGMLPGKLMTRDNLLSMQIDAVCQDESAHLYNCPTPVEAIVPLYVGARDQRSRYDFHRCAPRHGPS